MDCAWRPRRWRLGRRDEAGHGAPLRLWPATGAQTAHALFGPRSTLTLGLALFVTLALLRAIGVVGLGDHLAQTQPRAALKMGRDSPDTLASVALEAWQARSIRLTTRFALAALDRSPLNVHALRMEALGLEAQGKAAQAESLMQFAGTRGWRDDGVQIWLMRDAVGKHQFDQAVLHADALARRRSEMWPELFLMLDGGVSDEASSKALVARLDKRPNWRRPFLEHLSLSLQPDDDIGRLFKMVDNGPEPLTGAELLYFPQRLVREGRNTDALTVLRSYRNGAAIPGSTLTPMLAQSPR